MDIAKHFKNNWKNYLIGILLVIVVFGGLLNALVAMAGSSKSFSSEYAYDSVGYSQSARNSYKYDDGGFAPEEQERKVIKNANLRLDTDNFDTAKSDISRSVATHDVIVISKYESKYKDDFRNMNYRFKVPSEKLDIFLEELKSYAEVDNFNVYTNDVTGTYADYSKRLQRYQDQITRYEAMLVKPNLEIEDEISIQQRIDSLEDDIFYLKSRIQNIDEDVSYSDVSLTLRENPSVWSEIDFLGLKDGFKLFIEAMEGAVQTILVIAGFLLPFVLVYGIFRGIKRLF